MDPNGLNQEEQHHLLGLGTFSCAFAKRGISSVVKISRMGRRRFLHNEVAVLKIIGDGDTGDEEEIRNGRSFFTEAHSLWVSLCRSWFHCIQNAIVDNQPKRKAFDFTSL